MVLGAALIANLENKCCTQGRGRCSYFQELNDNKFIFSFSLLSFASVFSFSFYEIPKIEYQIQKRFSFKFRFTCNLKLSLIESRVFPKLFLTVCTVKHFFPGNTSRLLENLTRFSQEYLTNCVFIYILLEFLFGII